MSLPLCRPASERQRSASNRLREERPMRAMHAMISMASFMRLAAVLVSVFVLSALMPSALADANYLPLDGSNKNIKPSDFGYKIKTSTVNGQVVVEISLAAKAVKSFDSAELTLTKGSKTVVEATCGLVRLPDGKTGIMKLTLNPQVIDGGYLTISSAPIEGVVPARNFAGFRVSIERLLAPAKAAQAK
jgi:hypothetical protein